MSSIDQKQSPTSADQSSSSGWTRRHFMGVTAVAAGAILYPFEVSRHELTVEKHDLSLARLPEAFRGMRIVQLSDIHFEEFDESWFVKQAVRTINSLNPDLVILTGDFVSYGPFGLDYGRKRAAPCAEILSKITCPLRYASLGNHDAVVGDRIVIDALEGHGIPVLFNRATPIERDGARIWLVGLGSASMHQSYPETAIPAPALRNGETLLVMSHEPDILPLLAGYGADMVFSGHTHGGQIRFPFVPPIFLPPLGKIYVRGHFKLGNTQLYVNRGLGTVSIPARLNCPPEITQFTLV